MSANTAPTGRMGEGLPPILLGMASGALVAWLLPLINFPPEPAAVLASSATLIPAAIATWTYKRKRGLSAELRSLGRGELVRPTALIVALVAGAQLLATQLIAFVVGFCVGLTAASYGDPNPGGSPESLAAMDAATAFVVAPLALVVAFWLGRRSCHYFHRRPYVGLLLSVLLFTVLELLLDALVFGAIPDPGVLVVRAAFSAAVFAAAALGAWRGLKHHHAFVAGRLLRQLPPDDLAAVTALIHETVESDLADSTPPRRRAPGQLDRK